MTKTESLEDLVRDAAVRLYPRPRESDYGNDPVQWQEAYVVTVVNRQNFSEQVFARINELPARDTEARERLALKLYNEQLKENQ